MDKTVLITAGAKRMGKSFAKAMLKKKWSIALHYNKSKKEAEETAHYLFKKGGKVTLYKANFLDNEQTDKFIEKLRKENKDWKCLINNASMFQYDIGESFDIDTLNKHMLVNFVVPTLLIRALYCNLKSNNHIKSKNNVAVNILDAKLFGLNPDFYSYTLSKQSMFGLTKMSALSYAPILRVNGIAPGITLPAHGQTEEEFLKAHKKNLLNKSSSMKELENALELLVDSPSMTGHVILLDGGAHLSPPTRDVSFDN